MLKVFNVVGVAVVSVLMPLCWLAVPLKVGARSDVFSDSFGLLAGNRGFRDLALSGGSIDSGKIVSIRERR